MKRFGRILSRGLLGLLGLMLAAVFLLVGWLQSNDFQVRALRVVEAAAESALGENVTLGRIRVRPWALGVDLEGLHVFHGATGDTILSAERARIPFTFRNGRVAIGRLQVQAPSLHLHLDPDGRVREFQSVAGGDGPMEQLPFSRLRVTDGDLRIDHADGSIAISELSVTSVTGALTDVSGKLQLTLRGLRDEATFTWIGVEIGPDVVAVPALTVDARSFDLGGALRWEVGDEIDADLALAVPLEELTPALTPPRALHGRLDAKIRVTGPTSGPTVTANATWDDLGVDVPGVLTPLLTYELGEGTAAVELYDRTLKIEEIVLRQGERGRIVATGTVDLVDRTLDDGRVTATDLELEPLLRAFDVAPTPYVDFLGKAEVAWEGMLKPLMLDGTFDTTVTDLRVGDRPIRSERVRELLAIPEASARGRISLRHDRVLLTAESVRAPRNRGSAIVNIGLGPRGPLDLQADLFQADLEDFAPLGEVGLKGKGRISGRFTGPFNRLQFEGQGDVTGFEVLGIPYADHLVTRIHSPDMKSLYLEEAVATVGTLRYHGRYNMDFRSPMSLQTDITVQGGRIEDLVHMFVDLDGIRGNVSGGRLSLAGPLLDLSGEAHIRFNDVDLYGETFPVGEGHGFMDRGVFTLDDLRVRRADGAAGVTLRGTVDRAWKLDMELLADGLTIEGLDRMAPYEHGLTGRIAAHARITNTLFDPSPAGRIMISDVNYGGELADDSVIEFASADGVAHVTGTLLGGTARAEGTVGLWGRQPYAFDVGLMDVPAHLLYPDGADGTPITALVSGDLDLSGHFGETWSSVTLRAELVNVSVAWSGHTLTNQRRWLYEQDGRSWRLADVGLAGGATDVILERATGGDVLDLAGHGTIDLDLLRAVAPGLERADGSAELTFTAQGTRPDVKAVMTAVVHSDLFRHESAPVTFEDSDATFTITEDRFEIVKAEGGVGGGTWSAEGSIDARSFVPVRWNLHMAVTDAQVQWVETLPPAIGDAELDFDGPAGALLLSGEVTIDDMTFEDRIAWEDWVVAYEDEMLVDPSSSEVEAPLFSLLVQIDADRTIRLRNNLAEGTATAHVRLIGDTARPGLTGTVTIDEGLAFVQDREFRIDRGVLRFDDPWTWDPQLDISLVTDIDNQDQRDRVEYHVDGPFSDWNARADSNPPLPPADVNALLWFGMTTDDLEAQGQMGSAAVLGVVDLLVADFFLSGQVSFAESFSRGVGEALTPDRVDFVTGVNTRGEYSPDPRLLVEKSLDDEGNLDLRYEQDLARWEDYYLTISRRVGRVWSLSGWYAGLQRDRVLPIGGAYGVDVTARVELE